jgi:GNAT superfamily N-acetyltransferase
VSGVIYRAMKAGEAEGVLGLVHRVFDVFVAPELTDEGVGRFRQDVNEHWLAALQHEGHFIGVVEVQGIIQGIIALKSDGHISLFFVDRAWQKKGLGRGLFEYAVARLRQQQPGVRFLDVNSSGYAVPIYLALGFKPSGSIMVTHGIRHYPMRMGLIT